jgi:hypothetical protein
VDGRGNNTLLVVVDREGPVKLSFRGDLRMNHAIAPDCVPQNQIRIASLLDLTATKLKTVQQRAEAKDYRDIAAALEAGIGLSEALAAARAVYGDTFNVMAALKALTYFEDGNLPIVPKRIRDLLRESVEEVRLDGLPEVTPHEGLA